MVRNLGSIFLVPQARSRSWVSLRYLQFDATGIVQHLVQVMVTTTAVVGTIQSLNRKSSETLQQISESALTMPGQPYLAHMDAPAHFTVMSR